MAPQGDAANADFLRSLRTWAFSQKTNLFTLLGSASTAKHKFLRSFRTWARSKKSEICTSVAAVVVISVCIVLLFTADATRVWIGPLAAALLTVATLAVIWEFHWKRILLEGVFLRFNPPAKAQPSDRFFSPITLFSYEDAKQICQCGPEKMQLTLLCAENARIHMQSMKLSVDVDVFEFIAEIREDEKIAEATVQVKLAFDAITQKLRPLTSGQIVSPILDALKSVPDFLEKLSSLMTSAIIPLAHYLSSSDQAKQLREINRKLDLILEYRSIDQESELKSIYQQASEVLSSQAPIYATERFDTLKVALHRLENTWTKEIRLHLETAPNFRSALWRGRAERRFCRYLLPLAAKLQLFQLALFTDLCLAHATGTLREFRAVTVKDHVTEFKQISALCTQLCADLKHSDVPNYSHANAIKQATAVLLSFLESVQNSGPEKRIAAKAKGA